MNTLLELEVGILAEGREWTRGSGAVESLGTQLQQRLRGGGRFGQRPGLTHLLRRSVLVKNRDEAILWN